MGSASHQVGRLHPSTNMRTHSGSKDLQNWAAAICAGVPFSVQASAAP